MPARSVKKSTIPGSLTPGASWPRLKVVGDPSTSLGMTRGGYAWGDMEGSVSVSVEARITHRRLIMAISVSANPWITHQRRIIAISVSKGPCFTHRWLICFIR